MLPRMGELGKLTALLRGDAVAGVRGSNNKISQSQS